MSARLWKDVGRFVKKLDFDGAVTLLEKRLAASKHDRFSGLVGRTFSNKPKKVLSSINGFLSAWCKDFDVKAAHLEMNGFGINYDEWYFCSFGFDTYEPNPKKLLWLGEWKSSGSDDVRLTGLEDIQKDFAWYHENKIWKDKSYSPTYEAANFLVMVRFISLIEQALRSGALAKPVPVLAEAHDFGMLARFEP